jgi:hypothetical protein
MKVAIKTTKTVMKPVEETHVEEREYPLGVYPVQFRNYPGNVVHIQGTSVKSNREYGFAFNIPGQSKSSDQQRNLLSYAGTGRKYWAGSLIVNAKSAILLGINGDQFDVPLHTLPKGLSH